VDELRAHVVDKLFNGCLMVMILIGVGVIVLSFLVDNGGQDTMRAQKQRVRQSARAAVQPKALQERPQEKAVSAPGTNAETPERQPTPLETARRELTNELARMKNAVPQAE
jgi:hypothetical protein